MLLVPPEGLRRAQIIPRTQRPDFPTTCEVCHDTVAWTDSTFNHNNTAIPADRIARGAAAEMRRLPRKRQLHDFADRLHRLSSDRLQQQHKSRAMRRSRSSSRLPARTATTRVPGRMRRSTTRNTRNFRPVTATRIMFAPPATSTRITTPSSSAPVAMAATTPANFRTDTFQVTSTTASIVTSVIKADRAAGRVAFKPEGTARSASGQDL